LRRSARPPQHAPGSFHREQAPPSPGLPEDRPARPGNPLPDEPQAVQGTANRRTPRDPANAQVKAEHRKGAGGLDGCPAVSVLDVSQTGVRLVLPEVLPQGQEVEVLLWGPGLPGPVKRLGRVIWCLPRSHYAAVAGFAFDKPLSFAESQSGACTEG
jgi:hypothetical protein